ncbi:phosphoserine phosphatase SerB [Shewanella algae]|uniref:phosphoserine phosphatase SerB n=1 Tax=Shewanella algae TaxID=38313 RepID=UPI001AADF25C|nr:phosphoserine phosphatase SerB [Shewanella algae]MBO2686998.1 phosphoserine phosphatase SerB [Shewanella algae]
MESVLPFPLLASQRQDGVYVLSLQQHTWPAFKEGHHAQGERLRLIFSEKAAAAVADLLPELAPRAVAILQREQSLYGLELLLEEGICQSMQNRLESICELDYLPIAATTSLPQLSTPGLLVMDMDSTAITIECIDELAAAAGVGAEVAQVTERAMQGELDFEQSLRQRVAKLKGANQSIIDDLCARLPLSPGLESMIAELKSYGWRTVVASGGFTPFVGHLQQLLGLDAAFANELVISDGKLLGEVSGQVVDAAFKADVVKKCAEQWQIAAGQRLAIGDGANDIPMVQAADFGIAYHAKPKLVAAAAARINKLGLQVLPFLLQGR